MGDIVLIFELKNDISGRGDFYFVNEQKTPFKKILHCDYELVVRKPDTDYAEINKHFEIIKDDNNFKITLKPAGINIYPSLNKDTAIEVIVSFIRKQFTVENLIVNYEYHGEGGNIVTEIIENTY